MEAYMLNDRVNDFESKSSPLWKLDLIFLCKQSWIDLMSLVLTGFRVDASVRVFHLIAHAIVSAAVFDAYSMLRCARVHERRKPHTMLVTCGRMRPLTIDEIVAILL